MAGSTLAHLLHPPAVALLAAAGLTGLGLLWRGRQGQRPPMWGLALLALLLGAGLLARQEQASLPLDQVAHLADCQMHQVRGEVVRAPEPSSSGYSRRVDLAVSAVDGRPAGGLLRVYQNPRLPLPPVGGQVSARLRLKPVVSLANPGGFDYAAFLADQGIRVLGSAGQRSGWTCAPPSDLGGPARWVQAARQRLGGLLERLPPGPGRALLRALILGQRGQLSAELRESFAAIGVAHLLAISGLHLGMVWGLAFVCLRWLLAAWPGLALRVMTPKLAAALALIPCAAYATLAGGGLPTLRALVMAACLVACLALDRPYRPLGGLALAALVITLIWPGAPLTMSFQLSFAAVAAILLVVPPLGRRCAAWGLGGRVLAWLGVSAVVGLAVLPLTSHSFHQLPLWMVPANAVLVPLVAVGVLPLGLVGAALGLFWPAAGLVLWQGAAWVAALAAGAAQAVAGLEGGLIYWAGPGAAAVLVFYAAWLIPLLPGARRRWLAGGLAALLVAGLAGWNLWPQPPDGKLTVWVLDVGQGSAAVVRLPQGQVLVVDGGGGWGAGMDMGRRALAPFLWSQGLSRVEAMACSHPHPDHVEGLPFVFNWFSPRALWINGDPPQAGAAYGRLLEMARQRGVPVLGPAQLAKLGTMGGARVHLAWPPPQGAAEYEDANQRSLVLGLGLGRTWLWLPGDLGPELERRIAPSLPAGGRQVLVAPHHGGKGSCTRELLDRLRPGAVVFSAGCCNQHRQPRPQVRARARAAGARLWATARHGCVKLVSDGRDWAIRPCLQPPRPCPGQPGDEG